jgi:hypothetical protein
LIFKRKPSGGPRRKSMNLFARFGFVALLFILPNNPVQAQADNRIIIADPVDFSLKLVKDLETKGGQSIAEDIASALGNPGAKATLLGIFSTFEKRPAKLSKIASDKNYENIIRVITTYSYGVTPEHPYLYMQMIYKMSDKGWQMTGFNIRTEPTAAFPADMQMHVK